MAKIIDFQREKNSEIISKLEWKFAPILDKPKQISKNIQDLKQFKNLDPDNYFYLVASGTFFLNKVIGNTPQDRKYLKKSYLQLKKATYNYPQREEAHLRKLSSIYTDLIFEADVFKMEEIYNSIWLSHSYFPDHPEIAKMNLEILINQLNDFDSGRDFLKRIKTTYIDNEIRGYEQDLAQIAPLQLIS